MPNKEPVSEVALIFPLTSNFAAGDGLPMPTLPVPSKVIIEKIVSEWNPIFPVL